MPAQGQFPWGLPQPRGRPGPHGGRALGRALPGRVQSFHQILKAPVTRVTNVCMERREAR